MTRQEKHGWLIVASLFVTMLAIVGSGYDTTPVFLPALLKEFGWSRAAVSLLPSVAALTSGILVFPVVAFTLFVASYFAAAIASYISRPYEAEIARITPAASRASA